MKEMGSINCQYCRRVACLELCSRGRHSHRTPKDGCSLTLCSEGALIGRLPGTLLFHFQFLQISTRGSHTLLNSRITWGVEKNPGSPSRTPDWINENFWRIYSFKNSSMRWMCSQVWKSLITPCVPFSEVIWVGLCCSLKTRIHYFPQSLWGALMLPWCSRGKGRVYDGFLTDQLSYSLSGKISCTLPDILNSEVAKLPANFMSCLNSSLHENENYVKQNLVFCSFLLVLL